MSARWEAGIGYGGFWPVKCGMPWRWLKPWMWTYWFELIPAFHHLCDFWISDILLQLWLCFLPYLRQNSARSQNSHYNVDLVSYDSAFRHIVAIEVSVTLVLRFRTSPHERQEAACFVVDRGVAWGSRCTCWSRLSSLGKCEMLGWGWQSLLAGLAYFRKSNCSTSSAAGSGCSKSTPWAN